VARIIFSSKVLQNGARRLTASDDLPDFPEMIA
jgi:hypothetical protein